MCPVDDTRLLSNSNLPTEGTHAVLVVDAELRRLPLRVEAPAVSGWVRAYGSRVFGAAIDKQIRVDINLRNSVSTLTRSNERRVPCLERQRRS